MAIRKILKFLWSPFRTVKGLIERWINTSDAMSAEWIRRRRLEAFQKRTRY